jgi:pyruvate dehydrogenase E1 component
LRKDALACDRHNLLHPEDEPRVPYLVQALADAEGPVVAVSDFVKLSAERVSRWIRGSFVALGTDGFGMSDTRPALRRHFEIDAEFIALVTLHALAGEGKLDRGVVARAIEELGIDPNKVDPVGV